jgi:hypothetical protein
MNHIAKHAPNMAEVSSVVCFGLGRLTKDFEYLGFHVATCYLQHIAAIHIRNMLARLQGQSNIEIPIFVQDPAYCLNCKLILAELGITVLDSHKASLHVNEQAFVIAVAPSYPVRQIVGDMTSCRASGGPAGILCTPIDDDGTESSDGVVCMSSPNMEQFMLRVRHRNKYVVMRDEKANTSDEDDDTMNTVYYSKEVPEVQGSIFKEIGLYFRKKGT